LRWPGGLLAVLHRLAVGDLAENVECVDTFAHPKTGKVSKCFRIM
jgi:hypothetical protein